MPSVCDWAEVEVPSGRQGVSFREVAEEGDTAKAHRPYVVTETFFGETAGTLGWMVRTPYYKYILYDTGKNREQLYDMRTDRGEMRNLAVESAYKEEVKRHRALLEEWMKAHPSAATSLTWRGSISCNIRGTAMQDGLLPTPIRPIRRVPALGT